MIANADKKLEAKDSTANSADKSSEVDGQDFKDIAGDMDGRRKTAERSHKSLDATQMYLNEIGFSPLLSADEEKHYARLALSGDEAGRKRMIESNLRLVVKISRRYLNRQTIERAIMNQTRTIRLPIHVVKELNVYLRAARELSQKLDHEPSAEEIAELLEKPVADVKRMLKLNERVTSIDAPLGHDSERTVVETVADTKVSDPAELLQDNNMRASINNWLDDLSEKQREVIMRRFGLRGHESATLEQVGAEIGLTRERVRQIQVEALRRLKEIMRNEGLSSESIFSQ
jgi:RNA polymerase nonessential primary-like sigma factor